MFTIVIYDGQDGHYVGIWEETNHKIICVWLNAGYAVEVFFDGDLLPRFWGHGFRTDGDGFAIPTSGRTK
jgi:hypothetical protein